MQKFQRTYEKSSSVYYQCHWLIPIDYTGPPRLSFSHIFNHTLIAILIKTVAFLFSYSLHGSQKLSFPISASVVFVSVSQIIFSGFLVTNIYCGHLDIDFNYFSWGRGQGSYRICLYYRGSLLILVFGVQLIGDDSCLILTMVRYQIVVSLEEIFGGIMTSVTDYNPFTLLLFSSKDIMINTQGNILGLVAYSIDVKTLKSQQQPMLTPIIHELLIKIEQQDFDSKRSLPKIYSQ